ncbi:hypothetical protein COV17_04300 [Candidatus Woesearchaeota archaeon CG10_big_fil_rev_8_21_14_0_10_36_11]|nr:MAG: hypothetical protein COV17_04300 [Candidatus Woesearchaeota archaeon CG10_big_fil_rev_8_21_14_0_10_36_11]
MGVDSIIASAIGRFASSLHELDEDITPEEKVQRLLQCHTAARDLTVVLPSATKPEMAQVAVGERTNLTRERVRQTLKIILDKMRTVLNPIEDLTDGDINLRPGGKYKTDL